MFQMIGSFRETIEEWFDVRFQAHLYVSESGVTGAGSLNGIDPELMDRLLQDPAIDFADVMHVCYVKPKKGVTVLAGVDIDHWANEARQIWLKPPGSLTVEQGSEAALVSETFARRFGVLEGGQWKSKRHRVGKAYHPKASFVTMETSLAPRPWTSRFGGNGPVRIDRSTPACIFMTLPKSMPSGIVCG